MASGARVKMPHQWLSITHLADDSTIPLRQQETSAELENPQTAFAVVSVADPQSCPLQFKDHSPNVEAF